MIFCNTCGQCSYIGNDSFIASRNISGYQTVYVSPDDPHEIIDYGDENTDSDGIDEWFCPNCDSNDLDLSWDGSEEDAIGVRKSWEIIMEQRKKEREKLIAKENSWDK